jgi:hypothetical protein
MLCSQVVNPALWQAAGTLPPSRAAAAQHGHSGCERARKVGLTALLPALVMCRKLDKLVGVPVINIHIWFDRKLSTGD